MSQATEVFLTTEGMKVLKKLYFTAYFTFDHALVILHLKIKLCLPLSM